MIGLECPRPGTSARHSKPSGFPAAAATFQSNRAPPVCFIVLCMIFAPERFFFVIEGFPFLSRHEPPEEAISPPLRAFVAIGDGLRYAQVNAIEIRRRLKINRLLQIVRRRVIAFGAPAFDD